MNAAVGSESAIKVVAAKLPSGKGEASLAMTLEWSQHPGMAGGGDG